VLVPHLDAPIRGLHTEDDGARAQIDGAGRRASLFVTFASGLDQGSGHLTSIRPPKNEQLIPRRS
jgi:hypothetical protein